jgi:NarL family two-component system response regulator LiaR
VKRHVLIFGVVGGLLIAALQYTEYRFIIIEHSVELYGALVAILFAAFGIWLGLRITRSRETVRETIRETVVVREVLVPQTRRPSDPSLPIRRASRRSGSRHGSSKFWP